MPEKVELSLLDDVKLDGKVALITGGTKGIGFATAVELVNRGCSVVITSRERDTGVAGAKEIQQLTGKGPEVVDSLPLTTEGPLKDLVSFATEFKKIRDRLDIVIYNAGETETSHEKLHDNLCKSFVQRLAYQHVLTSQLWDYLKASGTKAKPSRVITTTGFAYRLSKFSPEDWLDYIDTYGVEEHTQNSIMDFPSFCVAQVGWTVGLGKACEECDVPVRFLLTHPGFVRGTGIATGCKQHCIFSMVSCFIGSHRAEDACLSNVAAAVIIDPVPHNGQFFGPEKITYGPPCTMDLTKEEDAQLWYIFSRHHREEGGEVISDGQAIDKIGVITLFELSVKTNPEGMPTATSRQGGGYAGPGRLQRICATVQVQHLVVQDYFRRCSVL